MRPRCGLEINRDTNATRNILADADANVFLNVIYDERPFVKGSRSLLEKIQAGKLSGITSSITEMEIALDLEKTGNRESIDRALRLIEEMDNLSISPLGSLTAKIAVKLVLDSRLTVHDAYHSAFIEYL